MVFSSILFLWIFLPIVLILYAVFGDRFGIKVSNVILLIASLFFYAWGEPLYIFLMLFSVLMNYVFALLIDRFSSKKKLFLVLTIIGNLGLLGFFKYYVFFGSCINMMLGGIYVPMIEIALPLGISFYTFQAMSYVIDVYRGDSRAQKNFARVLLYVSLFPQLIAGPIVKYKDIEHQLTNRTTDWTKRAYGIKRFLYGLAKKVLFANFFGNYADELFGLAPAELGTAASWLKMLFYGLQIYYDFSGYSDMAIGLGAMFGFDFRENFNYPYISSSVREFWRRWHISLSTWFKEYVYIPLGGNRKGKVRTYVNLLIVFFLTGLWHGASFNFIAWGMFYGVFLILERMFLGKALDWLEKHHLKIVGLLYTWVVFLTAWVFFREVTMGLAGETIRQMFLFQPGTIRITDCLDVTSTIMLILGILFAGPIQMLIPKLREHLYRKDKVFVPEFIFQLGLLFLCFVSLASDSYNAFIYFRF